MSKKYIKNYIKNKEFEFPPARFRGAPFWAWNTELDEKELLWQIEQLKEMGFGGFFMHTRSGMSTPYLGKEFMGLVASCVRRAKQNNLLAYLYDEDRWASGAAGGYVTQNKAFRQKAVCLSKKTPEEMITVCDGGERDPEVLGIFDIRFDARDRLLSYEFSPEDKTVKGEKWYVYVLLAKTSGWFNGYTYIDAMNSDAVDKFIEVTHEAYKREVGDEFGKTVPAVFTDEPNYGLAERKEFARDGKDVSFPWTQCYRKTFYEQFGYDIVTRLPELVWNLPNDAPSEARYEYYLHATRLFSSSFCERIGKWCEKNGIALTGHVLLEDTLQAQTSVIGEAMTHYRHFTIPGIDMLCNDVWFATAKQAQSVSHQCGKRGVASELYGVTGWEFDFRGHKWQGDWQAALGVTLRVPHLSWVSMRGSAKRDYPASIGYQSCWYKKYGFIENHFARVNTAMTRGKPCVHIAVVHPIESMWMSYGVREHTATLCDAMDKRFADLIEIFLRNQLDFDFVSESTIPDLYARSDNGWQIGEMQYRAVFVPPLITIRSTTIKALDEFLDKGGKVVVCGNPPEYVDGKKSNEAKRLYDRAQKTLFYETEIVSAFEDEREIAVTDECGVSKKDMFYNLRVDGEDKWLFIAHCDKTTRFDGKDCKKDVLQIRCKGTYAPLFYDTITGKIKSASYTHINGNTIITAESYPLDSFLFCLSPAEDIAIMAKSKEEYFTEEDIEFDDFAAYTTSEPNVAVLDLAEWSTDGQNYFSREEMLRIDKKIRKEYGWPLADGEDVQPWRLPESEPAESVWLRFTFESEIQAPCMLGYERLEEVLYNGQIIDIQQSGYYVDKAIYTMPLAPLKIGKNTLCVRVPVSARISLENMFLLGDFGVQVCGSHFRITEKKKSLAFGSAVGQGLPFYGGEIKYELPFLCSEGDLLVNCDYYNGALIGVRLDGKDAGEIVLPPYELTVPNVTEGKHILELTLYASRVNTFGALHACVPWGWKGPSMWYTEGNAWAYEYQTQDVGIMKKPVLKLCKKNKVEKGERK